MALPKLALDEVNVVVKGAFNPGIFTPAWLLAQELIGAEEYDASTPELITRELSVFSAGWLRCQVTDDSLQFSTAKMEESERLRDVVVGVLRTLEHTPIGAMGLNRIVHFEADSIERWHAIGDALAPKDPWKDLLILPGMKSVSILSIRPDLYGGSVTVQVEPSARVQMGIFVACNDHFDLRRVDAQPAERSAFKGPAQPMVPSAGLIPLATEILSGEWSASMARAERIISHVARLGGG